MQSAGNLDCLPLCAMCECSVAHTVLQQWLAKPPRPQKAFRQIRRFLLSQRNGSNKDTRAAKIQPGSVRLCEQVCAVRACSLSALLLVLTSLPSSWDLPFDRETIPSNLTEDSDVCECVYASAICKGTREPLMCVCVSLSICVCVHLWPWLFIKRKWAHEGGSDWGIGKCMSLRPVSNPRLIPAFYNRECS